MGVQVVSTMIEFMYCADTIVSHPRQVLHDLLPQQRQREGCAKFKRDKVMDQNNKIDMIKAGVPL